MLTINVHNTGGSGPYGASAYRSRATGCTERVKLDLAQQLPCDEIYKPTPTGLPNNLMLGTMVHALAEHELIGIKIPTKNELINFIDPQCGWDIPDEWQAEALRIYRGWVKVRKPFGLIFGAELLLRQTCKPEPPNPLGFPLDSKIDLLHQYPGEDFLTLTDFKTSGKSGDSYSKGDARVQQQLYTINAWSHGYDVGRIEIRQIVKTKEIKENVYQIDLPTPARERWLRRYCEGALKRELALMPGPRGGECDFCPHSKTGACRL